MACHLNAVREVEYLLTRPESHQLKVLKLASLENCLILSASDDDVLESMLFTFLPEVFTSSNGEDVDTKESLALDLILRSTREFLLEKSSDAQHIRESTLDLIYQYERALTSAVMAASPTDVLHATTASEPEKCTVAQSDAHPAENKVNGNVNFDALHSVLAPIPLDRLVGIPRQSRKVIILCADDAFMNTVHTLLNSLTSLTALVYPSQFVRKVRSGPWMRLASKVLWSGVDVLLLNFAVFSDFVSDEVVILEQDVAVILFAEKHSLHSRQLSCLMNAIRAARGRNPTATVPHVVGYFNSSLVSRECGSTNRQLALLANSLFARWIVVREAPQSQPNSLYVEYDSSVNGSRDARLKFADLSPAYKEALPLLSDMVRSLICDTDSKESRAKCLAKDISAKITRLDEYFSLLGSALACVALRSYMLQLSTTVLHENLKVPESVVQLCLRFEETVKSSPTKDLLCVPKSSATYSAQLNALWNLLAALNVQLGERKKKQVQRAKRFGFYPELLFRVLVIVSKREVAHLLRDELETLKESLGLAGVLIHALVGASSDWSANTGSQFRPPLMVEGDVVVISTLQEPKLSKFARGFGEFQQLVCFEASILKNEVSRIVSIATKCRAESIHWIVGDTERLKVQDLVRGCCSAGKVKMEEGGPLPKCFEHLDCKLVKAFEGDKFIGQMVMSQTRPFYLTVPLPFASEVTVNNAALILQHWCDRFLEGNYSAAVNSRLIFRPSNEVYARANKLLYASLLQILRCNRSLLYRDVAALEREISALAHSVTVSDCKGNAPERQHCGKLVLEELHLDLGTIDVQDVEKGEVKTGIPETGYAYCILLPIVSRHQPLDLVAVGPLRCTKKLAYGEACYVALDILASYYQDKSSPPNSKDGAQVAHAAGLSDIDSMEPGGGSLTRQPNKFRCTRVVSDSFDPKFWKSIEHRLPTRLPFNPFGWDALIGSAIGSRHLVEKLFADGKSARHATGECLENAPMMLENKESLPSGIYLFVTLVTCGPELEVYSRQDAKALNPITVYLNDNFKKAHGNAFDKKPEEVNHYYEYDSPLSFFNSSSAYEPRRSFALLTRRPINAQLTSPFVTWLDGVLACKTKLQTWHRDVDGAVSCGKEPRATLFSYLEFEQLSTFQSNFWDLIGRRPFLTSKDFKEQLYSANKGLKLSDNELPTEQPAMFFVAFMVGSVVSPPSFPKANAQSCLPLKLFTCNQASKDGSSPSRGVNFELADNKLQALSHSVLCTWDIDWLLIENVNGKGRVSLYNVIAALIVCVSDCESSRPPLVPKSYCPAFTQRGSQSTHHDTLCSRWPTFDRMWAFCKGSKFEGPTIDEQSNCDITGTDDAEVVVKLNGIIAEFVVETVYNKSKYYLKRFCPSNKDNRSLQSDAILDCDRRVSFENYYKTKYGLEICCRDAGFADGKPVGSFKDGTQPMTTKHSTLDQLHAENSSANKATGETVDLQQTTSYSKLLLEFCDVLPISQQLWRLSLQLPAIIERVSMLCVADQLRRELQIPNVQTETLMEALTSPSTADDVSYERLEILGDAVLKYLTSLELFLAATSDSEGSLASIRSQTVSNRALCKRMLARGWNNCMFVSRFKPNLWGPPGRISPHYVVSGVDSVDKTRARYLKLVEEGRATTLVSTKRIADCSEALLGAVALNSGIEGASEFALRLGVLTRQIRAYTNPYLIPPPSLYDGSLFDLASLETTLRYKFKNPSLAIQSFMHSRMAQSRTHSYERLEFLGDALLDMLMVQSFYLSDARLDPEKITLMKQLTVSNDAYARLAVSLGLERFIIAPECVRDQVEAYVSMLKAERAKGLSTVELTLASQLFGAPKVLGDVVESLASAMLIDLDYNSEDVWRFWQPHLLPFIKENAADLPSAYVNPIVTLTMDLQSKGVVPDDVEWIFLDESNQRFSPIGSSATFNSVYSKKRGQSKLKVQYQQKRFAQCKLYLYGHLAVSASGASPKAAHISACAMALSEIKADPKFVKKFSIRTAPSELDGFESAPKLEDGRASKRLRSSK